MSDEKQSAEVFISYASRDKAVVHPFADWLMLQGISVWIDRDRIPCGSYFGTEIATGLAGAKALLLMCSPNSMASEVVFWEVALAVNCRVYQILPVWLTAVADPIKAYPERLQLSISHRQRLDTIKMSEGQWYDEALGFVTRSGVKPQPVQPATAEAYKTAYKEKNWAMMLSLGTALLRSHPKDVNLPKGIALARKYLSAEHEELLTRLLTAPTTTDMETYLAQHPNGLYADHAKFRLASLLPLRDLGSFLKRAQSLGGTTWEIASAIARLRLKDRTTAIETLKRLRSTEPDNCAVAYYLAVGLLAQTNFDKRTGFDTLTLESLAPIVELLDLVRAIAPPSLAYHHVLATVLAKEYYERKHLRCPLGTAASLWVMAQKAGVTEHERDDLYRILQK